MDTSVPFGALPNSMAATAIATSNSIEIEKINYLSRSLYPQDPSGNMSIESRVQEAAEGKYRLIGDSYTLEYFARQHCLEVSGEFSSEQYALLLRRQTVYTNYLNSKIIALANSGQLKVIIDKYV